MNKIKLTLLLAAVALGLSSCDDNEYEYTAASQNSSEYKNIGFDCEESAVLALTDTEFEVTLSRDTAGPAVTVPVTVVSAPDFISVPSTVTFPADSVTAAITLKIGEGMKPFSNYRVQLAIPEEYSDVYSENPRPIVYNAILLKEDYETVSVFNWSDKVFFKDYFDGNEMQYSSYLNLYRCPDLFAEGTNIYFFFNHADTTFYFSDENGKKVTTFATGYEHPTYGMVSITILEDKESGVVCGYDDEEDIFYFPTKFTVSAGSFGSCYSYFKDIEWVKKPWSTE